MTPTVGPMPCLGCGVRVWYGQGRIVEPFSRAHCGWRRHSCKGPLASRAYWATVIKVSLDERRTYNRESMRRRRAA